jgi:hypothetical protein
VDSKLPDLSRTAAAINAYDQAVAVYEAYASKHPNDAEDEHLYKNVESCEATVGAAYGEDTKDRNDPETCAKLVRPGPKEPSPGEELSFVRRMVAKWKEQDR